MLSDLRQAFRTVRSSPGFSALVILVLAAGIGANTAIFSIVNGVLLRPLPFAHPDRLVAVDTAIRTEPDDTSYPDFVDWRRETKTLERLAAYATAAVTVTGAGDAIAVPSAVVTSDLFPMLGATPLHGRVFTPADDARGAERTVIVSEKLWASRFGRDAQIVGRPITLDGEPFTVIGVMPAAFEFPFDGDDPPQLWTPIYASRFATRWADQRGASFLKTIGLVRPGVEPQQVQAELAPLEEQLSSKSRNEPRTVVVRAYRDVLVKDYRLGLLVMLGAVGAVLLIACANVANLLLARGSVRRREIAVRVALGASRGRIVRQVLAESVLLAAAGGAAGAMLALWIVDLLVRLSPVQIPRLHDVRLDGAALAFTALASIATGVLSGVAPALQLAGANSSEALKDSDRGGSSARGARTRQTLVVAEVALSLVLLTAAGLLVRSFIALQRVSPGFAADHAVAMQLLLPESRYTNVQAMRAFERKLHAEMAALPGVSSAATSTTLPMTGSDIGVGYSVEGRQAEPNARTSAAFFAVSADYFSTLRIPVVEGRAFTDRDGESAPPVIIVNRTLASKYWPHDSALGKRITIRYNDSGPRQIVGVVGDVKQGALADDATPQIYAPFAQTPWPFVTGVVRTAAAPTAAASAMRAALARIDPLEGVADIKSLDEYVARSVATPRFTAVLVGAFATMALMLAALGLFSVMAYAVAQRRREIGIRMALGAQPGDVRSLVVRQALRMGVVGLTLGLVAALAASRILGSLLFGIAPHDPATFAGVSALLLGVMLVAAYVPVRRATRVDPLIALRTE